MEQGGSLRGGAEMRGQGQGSELLSNMEWAGSPLSPPGSDQNQNRLPRGEEEEEEWEALEDSENNNQVEEMDSSNRGRPEPKTVPRETGNCPESRSLQATGGDPSVRPSVCPPSAGDPPGPSPSLLASLQELGEHDDHALLPQSLHQIAEAYFLEKDYEWAVHFIHLERLYHERLLSNLAALQEQWESRWKASGQQEASSPERTRADQEAGNLDSLRLVCRTHHRSSLSVNKGVAGDSGPKNSPVSEQPDRGDRLGAALVSRSTDSITESLGPTAEAMGDATDMGVERNSPAAGHQEEMALSSHPSSPAQATPTLDVTDGPRREGGDGAGLCAAAAAVEPGPAAEPRGLPGDELTDSSALQGQGRREDPIAAETGRQAEGGDTALRPETGGPAEAGSGGGRESGRVDRADMKWPETVLETGEGEEEEEEEEEQDEDEEEEEEEQELMDVDDLEGELEGEEAARVGLSSLDDLAKRIQVEEIAPAEGLVSILKRRTSQEGASTPQPPPQVSKRKVRFREPDDGLDQDEVGGDSCLILLLLCLVTVVISLGGTALFCSLADAQSSVCSDFTQNVDFYVGHVQRGMEGLRYWFSPSS